MKKFEVPYKTESFLVILLLFFMKITLLCFVLLLVAATCSEIQVELNKNVVHRVPSPPLSTMP